MGLTAENGLGMVAWIARMLVVHTSSRSTVGLAMICLAGGGVVQRAVADDKVRYSARPAISRIVFGGQSVPVTGNARDDSIGEVSHSAISLLPGDFPLSISLDSAPSGKPPVVRLRTRLEGWEEQWHDHESQMYFMLRFLDEENRAVSSESFIRQGNSPGWGGLPQNSRWHRQVNEVDVPERSSRVQILLVSGGNPRTTGFWAVRRLSLSVQAPGDDATAGTQIYRLEHLSGPGLDSPRGNPDGWLRDGTGLDVPTLYSHADEEGSLAPLLALVDGNPENTGGWLQKLTSAARVEPGQRLRLEVEEKYSIGRGREAEVSFQSLPVGNYVFRAWATDELGRPTGPSLRLPVEVRPPFYHTAWFRLLGAGLVIAALLGGVRYLSWRKVQQEMQRLERRRAVEEERTRLARDLHDEMGARFTQISLLAGRALVSAPADEAVREPIRVINGAVKDLASALEEIVWAANPKHDTLEGFSNYLAQYAGAVLRDANLRCRLEIPTTLPERTLPSGIRHRLMMAVKEALNNALKHAHASEVTVRLELDGPRVLVTVSDNGAGFAPATIKRGNGLDHLERRMVEVEGTCGIESGPAGGTHIRLTVPLPTTEENS
jgi:signal transduction histidine kinase